MRSVQTELPATDFAITSVNVPDRLDLREVHDRQSHDEDARRSMLNTASIRVWLRRGLVVAILAALGWVIASLVDDWRTDYSAPQLARRLSAAGGFPVVIGSTSVAMSPSPRLILSGVTLDGRVRFDEVAVSLKWGDLPAWVRGADSHWVEVGIAPTTLKLDEVQALLGLLPGLAQALPPSVSTLRFDRVQVSDHPWLGGTFSASMSRAADGAFGSVLVRQASADGLMKLQLTPVQGSDVVRFQCDAQNWRLPFGPQALWTEVLAIGRISPTEFEVAQFSLGSSFGVVQGHLLGHEGAEWVLAGEAASSSLDLESMLQQQGKSDGQPVKADEHTVLQGTASMKATLAGSGPTLADAAAHGRLEAPIEIRWATLNGVNLGYAATRPSVAGGTSGGSTRFTDLTFELRASENGLALHNIRGRAGAMSTRGDLDVSPDMQVAGTLHVDLGATRVQAPIRVHVKGSALHPIFGR